MKIGMRGMRGMRRGEYRDKGLEGERRKVSEFYCLSRQFMFIIIRSAQYTLAGLPV